jgi:O-antigen biosynthesis protein
MSLPVVAIFGKTGIELRSPGPDNSEETRELRCVCFATDAELEAILLRERPHVLVSFGRPEDFPLLLAAPFDVRRRWINFAPDIDLDEVGRAAYHCFLHSAVERRSNPPLVSVFTPAYRTGERIQRPLRSLLEQSYPDWEWVILDDSDDDGATFRELCALARRDHRIGAFRMHRHSGRIGEVKSMACGLAQGDILVELDHDDELTADALTRIVAGFAEYPGAGFAYTNWAEVFEDGRNATYGLGWAFGYGRDHDETYRGRVYQVHEAPRINAKTIRHIVSAPNHLRAWKRDFYCSIGGHRRDLAVADDYELCLRTFLNTPMILVPRFCYIQYYNETGNTQRARNKDIQRLTRNLAGWYDARIHARFEALGIDDFAWDAAQGRTDWQRPNPAIEPHCSLIATD